MCTSVPHQPASLYILVDVCYCSHWNTLIFDFKKEIDMEKILALVFLVMFSCTVFANTVVGSNGEPQMNSGNVDLQESVIVTTDVLADIYGNAWIEACQKPGTIVAVKQSQVVTRDGLFHVTFTRITDVGIICDIANGVKGFRLVKDVSSKGGQKVEFNPFFIFWILAAFLMAICSRMAFKDSPHTANTATAIFVVTAATVSSSILFASSVTILAFIIGTVAAIAAFIASIATLGASTFKSKKFFFILAGVYSIAMMVGLSVFLFLV